jgi:hypothetical protein
MIKISFTPSYVYQQYRRRFLAGLLLCALTAFSTNFLLTPYSSYATTTVIWDGDNFAEGVISNTVATESISLTVSTSTDDNTQDDFIQGDQSYNLLAMTNLPATGGVKIAEGYHLTTGAVNVFYPLFVQGDIVYTGKYNYYSTSQHVIDVIDTQDTLEQDDDVQLAQYTPTSIPPIANSYVSDIYVDGETLYIATYGSGLRVIDTHGTQNQSDDTILGTYTTVSIPAISNNYIRRIEIIDYLLYVATWNGLSVIDTKGTKSLADDILLINYSTASSPSLPNMGAWSSDTSSFYLDTNSNLLYIGNATGYGLTIIDTQGTATTSDDMRLASYSTSTVPAIGQGRVIDLLVADGILYVGTSEGRLSVIDTIGNATTSDDSLIHAYTPNQLSSDLIYTIHKMGNFIYVGTFRGYSVIDTRNTLTPSDDIVQNIDAGIGWVVNIASAGELLLLGVSSGLYTPASHTYHHPGTYHSSPRPISTTPTTTIKIETTLTDSQTVALEYRTGSENSFWSDDFDTLDSYASDPYGWGYTLDTVNIHNGVLQVSNPVYSHDGYVWVDPGFPLNHFATSSIITARVRMTNLTGVGTSLCMFNDDYWDSACSSYELEEWKILKFSSNKSFTNIGFQMYDYPSLSDDATLEIDWINITTPDSMGEWSAWNSCPNEVCILSDLGTSTYLQYKLDLETSDMNTTPTVSRVIYQGDYQSSGTYTSEVETFSRSRSLLSFSAEVEESASTTVAFEYSLDRGGTWQSVEADTTFASEVIANSFRWKATLSTSDPAYTPSITKVTLTATQVPASTGSSVLRKIYNLEQEGKLDEAMYLRIKHNYFDDIKTDSTADTQMQIIVLATEVIRLFRELKRVESTE